MIYINYYRMKTLYYKINYLLLYYLICYNLNNYIMYILFQKDQLDQFNILINVNTLLNLILNHLKYYYKIVYNKINQF